MKLRIFFILFIISLSSINSFAQIKKFSDTLYVEELEEFMGVLIKNNEAIELEFIRFKKNWEQEFIADEYKYGIVLTSNLLLNRRAKANPQFYHYIKTINGFIEKDKMSQYMEWEVGLIQLLDSKQSLNKISSFLEFSAFLTDDNILVKKPAVTWIAEQDKYKIINDVWEEELTVESTEPFNLVCYNKSDTITIYGTEGILYQKTNLWKGKGGRLTWERAGFHKDSVYAELGNYTIDMNVGRFKIDSVTFTNLKYQQTNITGNVEDQLVNNKKKNYPRFYSDKLNIEIYDVLPNIDFIGGFNQIGEKFVGVGTQEESGLSIKRDDQIFISAKSKKFVFTDKDIESSSTDIVINMGENAYIFHSNVNLQYKQYLDTTDIVVYPYFWYNNLPTDTAVRKNTKRIDIQLLSLVRANQGGTKTSNEPFLNTYHKFNIYASEIIWQRGDSLLYITTSKIAGDMGENSKKATFESNEFFSMKTYLTLRHLIFP